MFENIVGWLNWRWWPTANTHPHTLTHIYNTDSHWHGIPHRWLRHFWGENSMVQLWKLTMEILMNKFFGFFLREISNTQHTCIYRHSWRVSENGFVMCSGLVYSISERWHTCAFCVGTSFSWYVCHSGKHNMSKQLLLFFLLFFFLNNQTCLLCRRCRYVRFFADRNCGMFI